VVFEKKVSISCIDKVQMNYHYRHLWLRITCDELIDLFFLLNTVWNWVSIFRNREICVCRLLEMPRRRESDDCVKSSILKHRIGVVDVPRHNTFPELHVVDDRPFLHTLTNVLLKTERR
jgi:hypothetical protein